jgi:hypothetical protein
MAAFDFNAENVNPNEGTGFQIIPKGNYLMLIEKTEINESEDKTALYFKAQVSIVDGPYERQKLFPRITLQHPNETAQRIGQSQFSQLCHAIGKLNIKDTDELTLIPFIGRVDVVNEWKALKIKVDSGKASEKQTKRFDYLEANGYRDDTNEIREYMPAAGKAAAPATRPASTAPAADARPQPATQPQPQAAATKTPPPVSGNASAPAWARKGASA